MERIPSPRLEVRDLELVLAVATAGSTVKAASVLHVTQSAVSRGLLLAEDKLGLKLFDRTTRGLSPTPAGARLLAGASALLAQLVDLERTTVSPDAPPRRVRLVCECYMAYRWLPSTLAKLKSSLPNVQVTLAMEHTRTPASALAAGEVDIALLTTSRVSSPFLELPLFEDEMVFLVAADHPLSKRDSLAPRDLREHPIITSSQTPDAEARWFMRRVFGRRRPRLDVLRLPLTEAIIDAARAKLGIAVLSERVAQPYVGEGGVKVLRLSAPPLRRPWRMAFAPELEKAATLLAAALAPAAPRMYPR